MIGERKKARTSSVWLGQLVWQVKNLFSARIENILWSHCNYNVIIIIIIIIYLFILLLLLLLCCSTLRVKSTCSGMAPIANKIPILYLKDNTLKL